MRYMLTDDLWTALEPMVRQAKRHMCGWKPTVCLVAWWPLRAYRKAARASRRRVERMVAAARSAAPEAEVGYLRRRQAILLRGLFPRGDVFPGNFIDEGPELHALSELLTLFGDAPVPRERAPGG